MEMTQEIKTALKVKMSRNKDDLKMKMILKMTATAVYGRVESRNHLRNMSNEQSSLHARMNNAAYVIFIMWNSISGLEAWYHFGLTSVVVWLSR